MSNQLRPKRPGPSSLSRRAFPPVAALRAFDAVARMGGVRKAADALNIDHAAISRQLKVLEQWTGAQLIVRAGSGITLTELGWTYHEQISGALDTITAATLGLIRQGDEARLHIWCVPGFAAQWLMPRLERFQASHQGLEIELHPSEATPNFWQHETDIQIQYSPAYGLPVRLPHDVRSTTFAEAQVFPVASSEYLARSPPIRCASDLLAHTLIQEQDFENWRVWFEALGVPQPPEVGGPRLWHGHLTVDAAKRGRGIALVNHFLAGDDLATGALVEVVAGEGPFPPALFGSYLFVTRPDRWNSPPVSRFLRWLLDTTNSELRAKAPLSPTVTRG